MSNASAAWDSAATCKTVLDLVTQNPIFFETFPCAIYLVRDNPDMTIIHGNSHFYTLFGCTEEDMRHKYANRLSALLYTESLRDLNRDLNAFGSTEPDAAPVRLRQHIKRGGGDAWIDTQAVRSQYENAAALFCVSFDVTGDERKLESSKRYAERAELIADQILLDTFEFDPRSGEALLYNANHFLSPPILGELPAGADLAETVITRGLVHPEYTKAFKGAFDTIRSGGAKAVCELRMKVETGQYVWTRLTLAAKQTDSGSGQYAVGILENVNQQKEMSLQYLNETQFYQAMLTEMTAFAQVDVTENRCTRFGGLWNLYNEIIDKVTYSQLIDEFINKVVHPEDRKHYLELMQRDNFIKSLDNGVDILGCEFRRIVEQNKMTWMELRVHLFRDPFTHHVLALLHIKDIDARKKQELALLHDSERDHLTNIFNKKVAENQVRDYLKQISENEICAFLILDLDNFKRINDTYGHKTGDQVLVRLVEALGGTFRQYDVVGRFGGDEFIILLKNIEREENVRERLNELYHNLRNGREPEISCSVGVSMVCRGDTYEQIFRQADIALYTAKSEGKKRYVFYEGDKPEKQPAPATNDRSQTPGELLFAEQDHEDRISFDAFISEQGDMAYLVDPDTFTLACGNKAFYDRIGRTKAECIGIKCYEAMHKRESPCPFCSKANWSTDKFYLWKSMNAVLEQEFLIKNKLVQWQGKEMLLAIAVDISNDKSVVDSMENGATESHSILSGVQRMAEAKNLYEAVSSALETIGYFFRAEAVRFWERKNPEDPYRCVSAWTRTRQKDYFGEAEVNAWLQGRKWDQPYSIESPESMLCYSYDMYQYMKNNNIVNQRWLQLRDSEQELGCIVIENISSNFQNVAFLESFSVFVSGEIKKRRLMESVLYLNEHDDLTDLLSRNSYERYLQKFSGERLSSVGVMVANFDNLKGINSSRGFQTGNYYLKQFASMLKNTFFNDLVFRLNGDEFLAIVSNMELPDLEDKITRLKALIRENGDFTVSIGYSWDNVEKNLATLIEQSIEAMQVEKKRHYDTGALSSDVERRKMLSELVAALEDREFEVFLQPKVELFYNKVIGAEALIRYRHPKLGIITPDKFISVLENNNLIRYIDLFVLEEVCGVLEKWKREGRLLPVISLNFSRLTLLERDILRSMEKIVSRYDVSKRHIEIEITESVANMGKSILYQAARELYEAGYSISLDDFGTEYANLSVLANIDFSMLKLDKSLVGTLVDQDSNQIILKNIISMCKDLDIEVVAEGVETQDQEKVLQDMKCRLGQGYLYGRPMPIQEFDSKYIGMK